MVSAQLAESPITVSASAATPAKPPHVPTRIRRVAPSITSSSNTMPADGQPMPVDCTLIGAPSNVPVNPSILLQTTLQNTVVISDLSGPSGGIMLKSATGATLIVNDTGIYIQNGKGASIVMVGPVVTVNNGALTVT